MGRVDAAGTPAYLAPEQVLGQPASPRSDVCALGLVAYECLTGRRPFEGDSPSAVATARVGRPRRRSVRTSRRR